MHVTPRDNRSFYGVLGLPGTYSDDQSKQGHIVVLYACRKWIPFWNIAGFSAWRLAFLSSSRVIPPPHFNSSLNFNLLAILGGVQNVFFQPIFNTEPLFGEATHYRVYSNVFKVFLSNLPMAE